MRTKIIGTLLFSALMLAACKPAAEAAQVAPTTPAAAQQAAATQPAIEPTLDFPASAPGQCAANVLNLPAVTPEDWILGSPDAKVTLLVYSDFQCPYCAQYDPVLDQLVDANPQDFRLVFRHFPLPYHGNANQAALAAEAAGRQGKFFEMKTRLFQNQMVWSEMPSAEFETWLAEQAAALKLDPGQFAADVADKAVDQKIQESFKAGYAGGVNGTPYVLVNGSHYQGLFSPEAIMEFVEFSKQQFTECPPDLIDTDKKYTATFKTEKGDVVVELFDDFAPLTVNSFVFLAREGWYDGVTFHRVLPGFVAQSGDPTGTGSGSPGYSFSNEVTPELRYDQPGRLGMANAGPDTNGSQFFITYSPQPRLDGGYTVFGQVTSGMEVVESLTPRDPSQPGNLPEGDKILTIEITEE